MTKFSNKNDIGLRKIPPLHSSLNPAETFTRPPGEAMKILQMNKHPEKDTLEQLLDSYRSTPHPVTGLASSAMLFSYNKQTSFPRQPVTERNTEIGREYDEQQKNDRTEQVNASKYRKENVLKLRDKVLIRNTRRLRKFGHNLTLSLSSTRTI